MTAEQTILCVVEWAAIAALAVTVSWFALATVVDTIRTNREMRRLDRVIAERVASERASL